MTASKLGSVRHGEHMPQVGGGGNNHAERWDGFEITSWIPDTDTPCRGDYRFTSDRESDLKAAALDCAGCPFKNECLAEALNQHGHAYGVWGGKVFYGVAPILGECRECGVLFTKNATTRNFCPDHHVDGWKARYQRDKRLGLVGKRRKTPTILTAEQCQEIRDRYVEHYTEYQHGNKGLRFRSNRKELMAEYDIAGRYFRQIIKGER